MLTRIRKAREILRKPVDQRTLSEKIMISGTLTGIEHAASLVFRLGSTLIVTRLLAPEIFGLFAIVMAFQYILMMMTDFGIRSLVIVSENAEDPDFLRTCWSVQIMRGLVLCVFVLLLASGLYGLQWVGAFSPDTAFSSPVLPAALAVSGLQFVIKAFESVNMHLYAKEMRFRRITILNISQAAAAPILTITIALIHPTVWALVVSLLLSTVLGVVLSYRLFPGIAMAWCWRREHVSELLRRGRWIMSSSALSAITTQADQFLFGAFFPASLLGIYFLAKQIFAVMPGLILKLHGAMGLQLFRELVMLPDTDAMRDRYYRYRKPIDLISFTLAGGVVVAAPALIDLMYDPRYLEAGLILQVLALGLPLTGLGLIRDAFAARKQFKLIALASLIQAATIWAGLIVALAFLRSPQAAFVVVALHRLPDLIFLLVMARRERWIDLQREFRFLPLMAIGALAGWAFSAAYFSLSAH